MLSLGRTTFSASFLWQSVEDWLAETEQKKAENPDYDPTYGKFKRGGGLSLPKGESVFRAAREGKA